MRESRWWWWSWSLRRLPTARLTVSQEYLHGGLRKINRGDSESLSVEDRALGISIKSGVSDHGKTGAIDIDGKKRIDG